MGLKPIEYAEASPAVRAVFDDIRRTRGVPDVNNFWKHLAHDPAGLKRTWESVKKVMAPGALATNPSTYKKLPFDPLRDFAAAYQDRLHATGAAAARRDASPPLLG